jgi:hypothetical protein
MSTEQVPESYHHEITSSRADLTSLRACGREFLRHFSPLAVLAGLAVMVVARIIVGRFSVRDLIPVAIVIAGQPFAEWIIHKYILHLPPLKLFGRRVELYGSIQHRIHHRSPSDLNRVLLRPIEVISFLIQIAILMPLIVWGSVTVFGGHFLPLSLTTVIVSYLGLFRYEWSHFLIHTPYRPKSEWYRRIWRNHRLHHFKHERYWLGVSSNFGDRVLGTNPDQRSVQRSPTARTLGVETD